jgi:hypothetical protein
LQNPFTPEAIKQIYVLSFGVPRNILSLCQQAYDLGDGERLVTEADVREAHDQLQIEEAEAPDFLNDDEPLATATV